MHPLPLLLIVFTSPHADVGNSSPLACFCFLQNRDNQSVLHKHGLTGEESETVHKLLNTARDGWYEGDLSSAEALDLIGQVIALTPRLARAWYERARIEHGIGRRLEALEDVQRAITLSQNDPRVGSYYKLYASIFASLGRSEEARRAFLIGIECDPSVASWYDVLSSIVSGKRVLNVDVPIDERLLATVPEWSHELDGRCFWSLYNTVDNPGRRASGFAALRVGDTVARVIKELGFPSYASKIAVFAGESAVWWYSPRGEAPKELGPYVIYEPRESSWMVYGVILEENQVVGLLRKEYGCRGNKGDAEIIPKQENEKDRQGPSKDCHERIGDRKDCQDKDKKRKDKKRCQGKRRDKPAWSRGLKSRTRKE